MAAAGKVAQRANEEFRRWKTHEVRHPTETNSSAFARAKHNREDAYAELARINARAEELRETDFELQVQEAAAQQNTTKEKILKAILRRKQEAGSRNVSSPAPVDQWTTERCRQIMDP